jgi:hypothetical protein
VELDTPRSCDAPDDQCDIAAAAVSADVPPLLLNKAAQLGPMPVAPLRSSSADVRDSPLRAIAGPGDDAQEPSNYVVPLQTRCELLSVSNSPCHAIQNFVQTVTNAWRARLLLQANQLLMT